MLGGGNFWTMQIRSKTPRLHLFSRSQHQICNASVLDEEQWLRTPLGTNDASTRHHCTDPAREGHLLHQHDMTTKRNFRSRQDSFIIPIEPADVQPMKHQRAACGPSRKDHTSDICASPSHCMHFHFTDGWTETGGYTMGTPPLGFWAEGERRYAFAFALLFLLLEDTNEKSRSIG